MSYDHWVETVAVTVTGAAAWTWRHLTGRITQLEEKIVGQKALDQHVRDQDEQFRRMHEKDNAIKDELSAVREGVARIEGVLSRMNGNGSH